MSAVKQILFSLNKIQTEQFAMFEDVLSAHTETSELNSNGSISISGIPDNRIITISVQSVFSLHDEKILVIKVSTSFQIEPSSWDDLKANGTVILPRDFVIHLESMALSTTRGVLAAKTEGTLFAGYMIPLVNMAEMVKGDVTITSN